jgi:hypothetical protein
MVCSLHTRTHKPSSSHNPSLIAPLHLAVVSVSPTATVAVLTATINALRYGAVSLGLDGWLDVVIGDVKVRPTYHQREDIPTCVYLLLGVCNNMTMHQFPFVDPSVLRPVPPSPRASAIAAPNSVALSSQWPAEAEWSEAARKHPLRLRDGSPVPPPPPHARLNEADADVERES